MGHLVDLLPAVVALLGERLELRHNGHQQLHDDGRGDVRVNAQGRHAQVTQRSAAEQVQETEDVSELTAAEDGAEGITVHPGYRHVRHKAEHHKHGQGEEQLHPQVWDLKGVYERLQQLGPPGRRPS